MPLEFSQIALLRDRHNHPLLYSAFQEGINLSDGGAEAGQDRAELRRRAIDRIRERAEQDVRGWTIAHGWNSGLYPLSKQDINGLPPVVIFNLSLHGVIVNDAGLALLKQDDPLIAAHLDDQVWIEHNLRTVLNMFAVDGASVERLQRFFRWLLAEHGTYYAEEMLLVDEREIRLFEEAGLIERTQFWAAPDLYDRLPSSIQGTIHGIKLFTDGALGARTAALHEPYRDSDDLGILIYETSKLEELIRRYSEAGKPIAVHAIGDRAIDQVVVAVETVGPSETSGIRIEHAQLISEPTARRAKELGITLCMQPNFSSDSVDYLDRLPGGYPERNNPFRMLIDRVGYEPGEDLIFGSDGMPHGWRAALQQALFPAGGHGEQSLTLDELAAGYCLPDQHLGHIAIEFDRDQRHVSGQVVLGTCQAL